jgi:hypothetical protein
MIFLKKSKDKAKNFWVEDYTETDKVFLESIGFKETKRTIFEKIEKSMHFRGSMVFGIWSKDETKLIYNSIQNHLGVNKLKIKILTFADLI